jgi:ribA/ribD-fused uncharacterized protein
MRYADLKVGDMSTIQYEVRDGFCLFYGGFLSQWYPCTFKINNILFENAEMYMMWVKNVVFSGPFEHDILNSDHPSECKKFGRMIPNFDPALWNKIAKAFVYNGNKAKFAQNPGLLNKLIEIDCHTFVECSPTDKIWGIGMAISDNRCTYPNQWLGTNWLGEVITDVRNDLR